MRTSKESMQWHRIFLEELAREGEMYTPTARARAITRARRRADGRFGRLAEQSQAADAIAGKLIEIEEAVRSLASDLAYLRAQIEEGRR